MAVALREPEERYGEGETQREEACRLTRGVFLSRNDAGFEPGTVELRRGLPGERGRIPRAGSRCRGKHLQLHRCGRRALLFPPRSGVLPQLLFEYDSLR